MYIESANRAYPANQAVLDSLIGMRYRLAKLVGFDNYADYDCADRMVETGKNARAFIDKVVAASGDRMKREYQILLDRKKKDDPSATGIDWWDRWYWTNLVKKEQYDFDAQVLRPYFPYPKVKQGVLDVTSKMFGVTYKRVTGVPVWDPSVETYEMYENGKLAGRFYLDMHPRKNKYNHAAQFDIRTGIEGKQIPEAALICNLPGGSKTDPGLCEYDDVNTFFHEFGHLLHNMFAGHHRWVGTGGIRTEADFVEAPSQMLEEWMRDPEDAAVVRAELQDRRPRAGLARRAAAPRDRFRRLRSQGDRRAPADGAGRPVAVDLRPQSVQGEHRFAERAAHEPLHAVPVRRGHALPGCVRAPLRLRRGLLHLHVVARDREGHVQPVRREQPAGSGRRQEVPRRGARAGWLEAGSQARRGLPRQTVQLRRLPALAERDAVARGRD
jgi:hypothetical protein